MNKNDYICFDLETTARSTATAQIQEIGAVIIDKNTFKIKDEFFSTVRPHNFDTIEDEALKVTKKTREMLETYPEFNIVWPMFTSFCKKHFKGNKNTTYGAPIPCGYNIVGYDIPIINKYCKEYGPWDDKWGNQKLFSSVFKLDVMDHMWFWLESVPDDEIQNVKLDTLREYMAFPKESKENAHNALQDARDTAKIVIKLLKVGRFLTELREDGSRRFDMRNCMRNDNG